MKAPAAGNGEARGARRIELTLRRFLENVVIGLMVALAVLVVVGVGFRKMGESLVWYDEVASQLLAWLTYYGAALAALHGAHIGVGTIVKHLRGGGRLLAEVLSETIVIAFLLVLTYAGVKVVGSLGGVSLTSLPWLPQSVVQSVIPIGGMLFMCAEVLRLLGRETTSPAPEPRNLTLAVAEVAAKGPRGPEQPDRGEAS